MEEGIKEKTIKLTPPWGWPGIMLAKSEKKQRWCVMFWFHTDDSGQWPHYTFTWYFQLRMWWPPLFFYRGWIKWEGAN